LPVLLAVTNGAQLTWTTIFTILGGIAAVVLAIWGIGRLFPASKKYSSAGGNALLRADVFFRPSREHIIEAKEHEEQQDEESGDPPVKQPH
jgi:hypothetical protein